MVITNMRQSPQWLYEKVYCQRGEIENRIKELHAMEIDRTSCSRFWANQFRVLLTAAAFVLMQELRLSAADTNCARAQVWTLRERFLKPVSYTHLDVYKRQTKRWPSKGMRRSISGRRLLWRLAIRVGSTARLVPP